MPLHFRNARVEDLPAVVALLADDDIGRSRDDPKAPLDPGYREALEAIERDPNQSLIVAERGGELVGTLHLTFLPGLSNRGAWQGLIRAVRIAAPHRREGLGAELVSEALARCRARGCASVQLSSDKQRMDAHRFYARFGFKASHEGFKIAL